MLTFTAKNKLGFMRKSLFYKRTLHTKDGVIPQYCCKEGSYLKVIPHNNENLDTELHSHNFYLILWIKKGQGTHSINFQDFPISDNQILLFSPGDLHKAFCTNEEDIGIPFTEDLLNLLPLKIADWIRYNVFCNIGTPPVATIDDNIAEILTKWIEVLKSLLENQKDDINYCTAATISVILKILKEHASWENDFMDFTPQKIKIIYDFKKSIEFNLKKSHSPAFYSIDIGVAESKLSAITKEIYGLSPKKIINEGIILKAKKLLAENELIIKEISEELGFTDAPHFVKFFKKETGMTPGQFKETL